MTTPAATTPPATKGTVLVVEDEAYVRDSLAAVLERRGFAVRTATSVDEALEPDRLAGLDLVLTDLKLGPREGSELVRELAQRESHLPVVVLTAYGTIESAVLCMRLGAEDYLLKPCDPDALTLVLERALGRQKRRRELEYLRRDEGRVDDPRDPIGVSEPWRRVVEMAELAAPVTTSVLLLGESGTGKEELAKLIHRRSARSRAAFVRVNCAAIPLELFESEFFGHRRGAFTGAVEDREGRFRVADGGTLFLDEVDSLPLPAQAKVLRVLQEGEFERVGDSRPTRVDVRLICASNTDIEAAVEEGRFRTDLYYRVNVMTLTIPPLRERPQDVPVLAEAFVGEIGRRLGRPEASIGPAAMDALVAYAWPGNVRELRNVLERGILLSQGGVLRASALPFGPSPEADTPVGLELRPNLERAERRLLEEALRRADGVRREAARLLGIDERNLPYYLKKHDLMGRR